MIDDWLIDDAELYEKDAEISHRLLDIKLADPGAMGMLTAGVFENAFDPYAAKLIALGYKVVKVEQMQANTKSSEKKNRPKDQARINFIQLLILLSLLTLSLIHI